jgi:hypothetical protein
MAEKFEVIHTDDIDGSRASETVSFGLDGVQYEIDLNSVNAELLRRALAPFISKARKGSTEKRKDVYPETANLRTTSPRKPNRASEEVRTRSEDTIRPIRFIPPTGVAHSRPPGPEFDDED